MAVEYRIILTATFSVLSDRDSAYTGLKNTLSTYVNNNPGKIKKAHMSKDDYFVADISSTEEIV
jgi:hypothetical protein